MASTVSIIVPIRIYAVRALVATSLLSLVLFIRSAIIVKTLDFAPYWEGLWLPLILITALHHALAVLEFKFMYNIVDLIFLAAEVATLVYGFCRNYYMSVATSLPIAFSPHAAILAILCLDRIFLAVNGLWRHSVRYLIKPVCLVSEKEKPLWRSRWQILCGRHLLSSHLLGETARVIVPRLMLAYMALSVILGYIYFIIIERPWQTDQVWTKQKIVSIYDHPDLYGYQYLSLTLSAQRGSCEDKDQEEILPVFSVSYYAGEPLQEEKCTREYLSSQIYNCPFITDSKMAMDIQQAAEKHPQLPPFPSLPSTKIDPQIFKAWYIDIFNHIPTTMLVTYDFTCASGLEDEVDILFEMSTHHSASWVPMPIRLTRGGHEVVSYTLDFWEELDYSEAPSFWRILNPNVRRHPTIREVSRSLDTARNVSAYGPNTGSLRLKKTRSGQWSLYQLVLKSDTIDAFASVGGLWTLLNGIFLIICGRSLLGVLIGQRPLSAVGWLHFFDRKRIQAATQVNYPHVQADQADAGLPALIADHFLDMGPAMEKPGNLAPRRYQDLDAEGPGEAGGEEQVLS